MQKIVFQDTTVGLERAITFFNFFLYLAIVIGIILNSDGNKYGLIILYISLPLILLFLYRPYFYKNLVRYSDWVLSVKVNSKRTISIPFRKITKIKSSKNRLEVVNDKGKVYEIDLKDIDEESKGRLIGIFRDNTLLSVDF